MSVVTLVEGAQQYNDFIQGVVNGLNNFKSGMDRANELVVKLYEFSKWWAALKTESSLDVIEPAIHEGLTPQDAPAIERLGRYVHIVAGNSFKYRGRILSGLTLNSQHGKFLRALLAGTDDFATDKTLFRATGASDIRDLSFTLRNLKNAFKTNGLKIVIEDRKKPDGYIFIGIKKLA